MPASSARVSLAEATQQVWDEIIAVNLSGAFHTMRRALPGIGQGSYGRVINIASVHGLVASVSKAPYVSAKFGLIGLSRVAALEYAAAARARVAGSRSTASARAGPKPRLSSRRFWRARPTSAATTMPGSPACSRRNSRPRGPRGRRRSGRSRCGSPIPWRTTSPAPRSRSTAAGRRNRAPRSPVARYHSSRVATARIIFGGAGRTL
jgi:hypothetical protein